MKTTAAANKNSASIFLWNRLKHSLLTPFLLLRYMGSSILTMLVDYAAFITSYQLLQNATICIFIGRFFSIIVNYFLLRKAVFISKRRFLITFAEYVLVVLVSGGITSVMVNWLQHQWNINVILGKMIAEGCLYFFNFLVLKKVFENRPTSLFSNQKS